MDRHLFLFGSGPPFTKNLVKQFTSLAEGEEATIAVFYEDDEKQEGSRPVYTDLLIENGVEKFLYFPLQKAPDQKAIEELKTCTGVIIGSGDTEKYQDLIVDSDFAEVIKNHYLAGRPVAGFSAGAVISPEHCVISPKDNPTGSQLYKKGLGLLEDIVISVHFDTWEEEFSLKIAMKKTNSRYGYGIDESAGIYFKNEKVEAKDGNEKIHFYKQKEME